MSIGNIKSLQGVTRVFNVVPNDVVGIELRSDGVMVLRAKRNRQHLLVESAEVLPAHSLSTESPVVGLNLPGSAKAVHAGLVYGGEAAHVKLLSLPGNTPLDLAHVRDALGLKESDGMRVAFQTLKAGGRREEHSLLGVAMPEDLAAVLPQLLTANRPVPHDIEVSPVAVLNAFEETADIPTGTNSGMVFVDVDYCFFAFFRHRELLLLRRSAQGSSSVLEHIRRKLGVDAATAQEIVSSGAVDVSTATADVLTPLIRQITLSRDFIERHANQPVTQLFLGGDPMLRQGLEDALRQTLRIEIQSWDPFKHPRFEMLPLPALDARPWAFVAALGCCLGMLSAGEDD